MRSVHFLLILSALVLSLKNAGFAAQREVSIGEKIRKCRNDWTECSKKLESKLLDKAGRQARREGDFLTVNVPYKGSLSYKNSPDHGEGSADYKYWGFYDNLQYHLIGYYGYEWHYYYFVSRLTGNQTVLSGLPHISPDNTYIATVAASESRSHGPNELVIWKHIDGRLEQVYKHKPDVYALYEFIEWETESTVKLKKFTLSNKTLCPESSHMTIYVHLVLNRPNQWNLVEKPDAYSVCH